MSRLVSSTQNTSTGTSTRTAIMSTSTSTHVTITSIHKSLSSTTQVVEHGQWVLYWVVTTGIQIGRLIEFCSTETANLWRWYGGRISILPIISSSYVSCFRAVKLNQSAYLYASE